MIKGRYNCAPDLLLITLIKLQLYMYMCPKILPGEIDRGRYTLKTHANTS